jgi:hypothetical protein
MTSPLRQRLLLLRWWMRRLDRRQVRRWAYKLSRPASDLYVSGDGFRRLADHVYDGAHPRIAARRVKDGEVIFAPTSRVQRFFAQADPKIGAQYNLITHNADLPVDEAMTALISDRVLCWYAQNSTHAHPRVVPIPIGLENLHYYHAGIPDEFDQVRALVSARKSRILVNFAIQTNPQERQPAYEKASRTPTADCLSEWLAQQDYMRTLSEYKFVLSPPGNGLDAHRTWEAMYLGVVPIVKDSYAMRVFQGLGLPLWIVGDWDELLSISEGELESTYEERKKGFDCPALYMDYWRKLILGKDTTKVDSEAGSERREAQA